MSAALDPHDSLRSVDEPLLVMGRIAEEALRLIPRADGAVVQLTDGDGLVCVAGAGVLARAEGERVRTDASLSGMAMLSGSTLCCGDADEDPRADRDVCRRVGVVSMICVPLRYGTQPIGALTVSSKLADAFNDRDLATLTGLAEFITATIATASELNKIAGGVLTAVMSERPSGATVNSDGVRVFVENVMNPNGGDADATRRIEGVLGDEAVSMLFQPIVDLATGQLTGAEALSRFLPGPYRSPDQWFAEAHRVGLGIPLELMAVHKALAYVNELPPGCYLGVNVGPETIVTTELAEALSEVDPGRVVLELTEHDPIDDYDALRRTVMSLRERGLRLAIDDIGSGISSLSHIAKLAPDILKIDLELVRGLDLDPVRRHLVKAIVSVAPKLGATLVAEGVETEGELEALRALGVSCGQGYLLGRPGPVELLRANVSADSGLHGRGIPVMLH